jgi:type I restriction enzyme S subunit
MANQEMKICAEEALNGNLEDCARLLFPQEGETMPKLRFSGFEGEWERKLLSECLEISEEKNTDNKFGIEDVLSVSDDYGVVNQIELLGRSYAGKSVSGYKILRPGQIVYTKSPLKAKPYGIVKQNTGEAGIVSVLYAVYNTKEGVAPEYIHYYFDPAWRLNAYMRPLVNKGAKNTMNISDETALTGYIMIPKDIEEQRRIATYLRSLDEQIAIQQQQLERLKKMKQSCLGLLFADNQSITPPPSDPRALVEKGKA